MKKQTAVEWLIDKLPHSIETQFKKHIDQAKEMEKEQIINSFKHAQVLKVIEDETRAEQYYNETYKSE